MSAEAESTVSDAKAMLDLTASEAAAAIRGGRVKSEALVGAAIAAAEANMGAGLRAITAVNAEAAKAEAAAADARVAAAAEGEALPPLLGVPLVVKDNVVVKGLATGAGTPALEGWKPAADAPVIEALKAAGAIVLAHTNMHELAFGVSGHNAHAGDCANAYDRSRITGGSSSGTGSAVGARLAPGGLGTDTGGSVRIPASLNGCCGLRATVGRYSAKGVAPLSHTRDTVGPIARSVADLALLDSVMRSTGTGAAETDAAATVAAADLKGLRIGVPTDATEDVAPETAAAFTAACDKLAAAGAVLVPVSLTEAREITGKVGFPVVCWEVVRDLAEFLTEFGAPASYAEVVAQLKSPDVKGLFEAAVEGDKGIPDEVYEAALKTHRPALIATFTALFEDNALAAIALPTTPLPAAPREAEDLSTVQLNGKAAPLFPTYIRNTDPGSNAGFPGLTLPCGMAAPSDDPSGRGIALPIGLSLDALPGRDRELLGIALAAEAVLGGIPAPTAAST